MKDGVILDNDEDWGGDTCKTALHASHFCLLSSVTLWRWWCQETLSPLSWQTWKYSNNVRDISTASGPAGREISSFQSSASAAQHLDVGTLFKSNQSGEHKTDRYLPLTWHLKTSPAGGGKARVSPDHCSVCHCHCLVSCLPLLAFVKCAAAGDWMGPYRAAQPPPLLCCPCLLLGSPALWWRLLETVCHLSSGDWWQHQLEMDQGPHTRWQSGDPIIIPGWTTHEMRRWQSSCSGWWHGEVLQQANNQDNTFTGHWTV